MTTSHEVLKVKPNWRFLFSHPAHMLAFGLGLGLVPRSPGTAGTLLAFPFFWYMSPRLSDAMFIFVLIWMYVIGVWVCDITGKALGEADFGGIVWDEVVAFLLVLFFTPDGLIWQLLAFSLFRFFDIVKPQPIRYYDSHWHGGLGVMFDDLLAAGYTLLCLAFLKSILL
ncbi:MAG: phosphatidylglycerophosphatase A [Gammaproteobacteria bacterium]|nr:phosphatidylglycerophosphatase A [Sideroxydans sp.]MBU3904202.1 phosphatidylglycerophosphatase A [Gammaproteobacteria bacterium]MBU4045881.1 phosphatidylglycerophosphatase A [Gammaproteobacteria bacterium]MBU4150273.1 phosphatidylglycerophosphatase A [Gammaproteobacteria bacterium]